MTGIGLRAWERARVSLGLRGVDDEAQAGVCDLWEVRLVDIAHDRSG
jgi:hypothetical protein